MVGTVWYIYVDIFFLVYFFLFINLELGYRKKKILAGKNPQEDTDLTHLDIDVCDMYGFDSWKGEIQVQKLYILEFIYR